MYTNDETIKVTNNESLKKVKIWKNKFINKSVKFIRKNKFLLATLSAFLLFSIANAMMICTFLKILQRV